MADDESPLVRDIWISDAGMYITNEDSVFHNDSIDIDVKTENEAIVPPSDLFLLNYTKEEEIIAETMSVDQFLSNSGFDILHTPSISLSSPSMYTNLQQHCSPIDSTYHPCLSLSFSNPPESIYHVRYLSEITNSPLDGNIVNTKKKTKKKMFLDVI